MLFRNQIKHVENICFYWHLICYRWLLTRGGGVKNHENLLTSIMDGPLEFARSIEMKILLRNQFQPIVLAQTISWRRGYSIMVDCSGVLQKFNGNDNVFLSFLPLSPFYNLPRNTILHSTYRTVKVQYQNYLMYISYLSSIVCWPPLIFCSF